MERSTRLQELLRKVVSRGCNDNPSESFCPIVKIKFKWILFLGALMATKP